MQVFLDGSDVLNLSKKTAENLGLAVGQELSEQELERIKQDDELRQAKEYAALLLSYRARTLRELRSRLLRKGFSEAVTDAAIRRLAELRLVDDAKFAQDYAEARIRAAGRSRRLVKAELTKLGVSRLEIEAALRDAPDEAIAAKELVAKYARRYTGLDEKTRKKRLFALLARRGFAYSTISQVLELEED
ncbi:MAG: regulatory protein RecX [candidate division WOR-3 bacterium]